MTYNNVAAFDNTKEFGIQQQPSKRARILFD